MKPRKLLITLIVGTLLLFVWNGISWMVLPFHSNSLKNIPEDALDMDNLKRSSMEDGVFHYPGCPKDNSKESKSSIQSKLIKGPRITLMVYKKGSTDYFKPSQFIVNFIFNLLTVSLSLFIAIKLRPYTIKTLLTTLFTIAIVASLVSDVAQMNWYLFPIDYTVINVFDKLISFGLLGLLFGWYTFKNYADGN